LAKDEFFREKKRGMLSFYKESNSLVMSFPELLFKFTQQDKILKEKKDNKVYSKTLGRSIIIGQCLTTSTYLMITSFILTLMVHGFKS